jgi:excisionase family DNA binding protein
MEQVFFNVPLIKLEPIFKRWVKEVIVDTSDKSVNDNTNENPFLDTDEAAKFLKRKKSTIYSKVCRGELPHIKKDGKLIFERQKLIEYLESGRVLTDAEIKENAHNYLTTKKKGLNNG